jgi:multiple sugar transport system ATP-binding protein
MAGVTLVNVSKTYGKSVDAVRNVNLTIHDKELMVLVGPSGCGKSTILRMIAGPEKITAGQIYVGEKLVNEVLPKDRDIAMVFQNYALYPHMSVYDNMEFSLKLRKTPKDERRRRVTEAAKILGIPDLLERKPKALSGGQRQRVALGRAIVRNPKVFLFDEPLSNLDAKLRVQMRTEISKLHHELRTTMIYVTHDQVEAMTMGDRIAVLKDGIVQQIDKPLDLYRRPGNMFTASFIGSPSMNLLEGKLTDSGSVLNFDGKGFRITLNSIDRNQVCTYIGKSIVCGVRPEDIYENAAAVAARSHFASVELYVDVIEPMGNETYLYLLNDSAPIIARLPHSPNIKHGHKVPFLIDTGKVHLFDPTTGKSICASNSF